MPFRFIHSADLHLGRRFCNLPEDVRGRLVEARHQIIGTLAQAARQHDAQHILIAGDMFDTESPTDPVLRQAIAAMADDPRLHWWLIPGHEDSLAAKGLWTRFRQHAPTNVHLIDKAQAVEIAPGAVLLPAPLPRRDPGRDLTAWMQGHDSDPHQFRIGLAHAVVHEYSDEGNVDDGNIPLDRADTARLDYLALGGWHRQLPIGERTFISGTPERDDFHHDGPGVCLGVTLSSPGALPTVRVIPTGTFVWTDHRLSLSPGQLADAALLAVLPGDNRRDRLLRLRVAGKTTLAEQAALGHAAEGVAPEFWHFMLDLTELATDFTLADLDDIDPDVALPMAAEANCPAARDDNRDSDARRVPSAARNCRYG